MCLVHFYERYILHLDENTDSPGPQSPLDTAQTLFQSQPSDWKETWQKSVLSQNWYQESSKGDQQKYGIALCTNIQDRLGWVTIEVPQNPEEYTQWS